MLNSLRRSTLSKQIELIDLCHAYVKGKPVFKHLNLKLDAGAHYLLSGPNGSGKTTLSKILCGLLKPTSGEIRVNGKIVQPWRTPGRHVSYHFQNPDFQLFSSSVNNQLVHAHEREALAAWFGLDKHLNEHPLDLPFVLKKRVAIASTLGRQTGCVVLDEPTLGQDSASVFNRHYHKPISDIFSLRYSSASPYHWQNWLYRCAPIYRVCSGRG